MSLKANIFKPFLKPLGAATLAIASFFPGAETEKAEAQFPTPYYYPYQIRFAQPNIWGPGPFGAAGTFRSLSLIPLYQREIENPGGLRYGYPMRPNYSPYGPMIPSYGQRLARPTNRTNSQNRGKAPRSNCSRPAKVKPQNQVQTKSHLERIRLFLNEKESTSQNSLQEITAYEKELQKQINNSTAYSSLNGVYKRKLMESDYDLIIPDNAKTFKLPKMDRMYRIELDDGKIAYLVTNDKKVEKKEEKSRPYKFEDVLNQLRGTP